jgi:hypothetical protein
MGGQGGRAGAGAVGGSSGRGTLGGSAGTETGLAGAGEPPAEGWTCWSSAYDDGEVCDCGCGTLDPDCDDEGVDSCETCFILGGCANGQCPSNVDPDDNSQCLLPADWLCGHASYGDGLCDCGCVVTDIDCESTQGDACDSCPIWGCSRNACSTIDPENNAFCTAPPSDWTCSERLYRDGSICNCGCGFRDPDCATSDRDDCDDCNAEGSCSGQECPGLIDPDAVEDCVQPSVPNAWTCYPGDYGSSLRCDCGCGVPDPDCRSNDAALCETCGNCGIYQCPDSLLPGDTTQCKPPPESWICEPEIWGDGNCDCGCGVVDIDCDPNNTSYCLICRGCSQGHCERIDPKNTGRCTFEIPAEWTCSATVYWDGVCDCGCGALDRDCLSANKSACDVCNGEGSCSDIPCLDPGSDIASDDNTSCTG